VLEGESALYRYTDRLEFESDGSEATRLRYAATLELRGPMAIADAALQPIFRRIGDDATRDLVASVVAGT
jgi:hypothetical protein